MDQLSTYRTLIKQLLTDYAELMNRASQNDIESHTIYDEVNDRYMLFRVGWQHQQRIEIPYLYVRIKDDKIWIEEDYTEAGIATPLLAAGVPNQGIVLAFHHPDMRSMTEFAVA